MSELEPNPNPKPQTAPLAVHGLVMVISNMAAAPLVLVRSWRPGSCWLRAGSYWLRASQVTRNPPDLASSWLTGRGLFGVIGGYGIGGGVWW